jgi:hypothetical protein
MAKKPMNNYQSNNNQKFDVTNKQSQYNPGFQSNKTVSVMVNRSGRQKNSFLTHEQIAERAKSIWIERGCPSNQDEQNWLDAENQLKQEFGIF